MVRIHGWILEGITGFFGNATHAVTETATAALGAAGGVAQGAIKWAGTPTGMLAIGAVAVAAVGGMVVHNMSKDNDEENTQGRRTDWAARYQSGELGRGQGVAQNR